MTEPEVISTTVSSNIEIELDALTSSGYVWEIIAVPDDIVKITGMFIYDNSQTAGGKNKERFTVTPLKQGECIIEFKQKRNWQKNAAALTVKKFKIVIS